MRSYALGSAASFIVCDLLGSAHALLSAHSVPILSNKTFHLRIKWNVPILLDKVIHFGRREEAPPELKLHTQRGWSWSYCSQAGIGILCMFLNWVDSCFLKAQKKLEAIKGLLLTTKGSLNSWMSGVGWHATRAYSSLLILKVWHLSKNRVLGFILTGRGVNVMS